MKEATKSFDKIRELRDLINSSICYAQNTWNRKDTGDWSKLCVSMDNIEDTQVAIDEYLFLDTKGYLAVYGVLQAFVVQQDAIKHLEEAIGIKAWTLNDYPKFREIRNIRIETIGHPTKTERKRRSSTFEDGTITYTSVGREHQKGIVSYVVWSKDGAVIKEINIKEPILLQEELLKQEIIKIMERIKRDEKDHKVRFKEKSLISMLGQTSYLVGKLWSFERSREHSQVCFEQVFKIYNEFKEEIKNRYKIKSFSEFSTQVPGLINLIQHLDKIFPRIKKMILMEEDVDKLDLDVYVQSLDISFQELQDMAREVDETFSS